MTQSREATKHGAILTGKNQRFLSGISIREIPITDPDSRFSKTRQLMEKNGLRVIRFHDLRHTAATLLAPRVSQQQLRGFLGHADKSVTYGVYAHLMDKERKKMAEIMNDILEKA